MMTTTAAPTSPDAPPSPKRRLGAALRSPSGARLSISGALILAGWISRALTGAEVAYALPMIGAAMICGWPILRSGISGLRHRIFGIDLLVSTAAIGALILGDPWEAAAVTFLFALGKSLEQASMARTRGALQDLIEPLPQTARLLDEDGKARTVSAREVQPGDRVLVRGGDRALRRWGCGLVVFVLGWGSRSLA